MKLTNAPQSTSAHISEEILEVPLRISNSSADVKLATSALSSWKQSFSIAQVCQVKRYLLPS